MSTVCVTDFPRYQVILLRILLHFSPTRINSMKKLLFTLTLMFLIVAYLTGCQQDPSSSKSLNLPMSSPPPADAHPAWAFTGLKTIGSYGYSTIAVSDSDQTDIANVYTCSATNRMANSATWSTNGG